MEINQLKPVDVVRDEDGSWAHPEYLKYLDEKHTDQEWLSQSEWDELKRYFNIQTCCLWLSATTSFDDYSEIMESANLSKWNPITPDGFFLIDICFSEEDDALAMFARPIRETEVA